MLTRVGRPGQHPLNVDDERPSTGELLTQWRDATRAAELAERLARSASEAAGQEDRSGLASDEIVWMAEKAAFAAERAARSARQGARLAADRYHEAGRPTRRPQGVTR